MWLYWRKPPKSHDENTEHSIQKTTSYLWGNSQSLTWIVKSVTWPNWEDSWRHEWIWENNWKDWKHGAIKWKIFRLPFRPILKNRRILGLILSWSRQFLLKSGQNCRNVRFLIIKKGNFLQNEREYTNKPQTIIKSQDNNTTRTRTSLKLSRHFY